MCAALSSLRGGCARTSERHREISESVACGDCRLAFRTLWASRENDDHVMPAGFYFEIEDTLWALGNLARSSIARFSLSSGISTIVDKRGAGPGEFTYADVVQLHPAGDTLLVFHGKRLSYFTVQLTEARSVQTMVGAPAGMLVLPNQQVVFVEPRIRQLARASGYVLHKFGQKGRT